MPRHAADLADTTKYPPGRFVHLQPLHKTGKKKNGSVEWECRCTCGNLHSVTVSKTQQAVMRLLQGGHKPRQSYAPLQMVYVNGKKVCNRNTMDILKRAGLVRYGDGPFEWVATDAGKAWTPAG